MQIKERSRKEEWASLWCALFVSLLLSSPLSSASCLDITIPEKKKKKKEKKRKAQTAGWLAAPVGREPRSVSARVCVCMCVSHTLYIAQLFSEAIYHFLH